jgi:hypothetical protein
MKLEVLLENEEISFETYINKLPRDIVEALKNAKQNPDFHPEGNAYNHTKQVFNLVKRYGKDLAITAVFHDLGKIDTSAVGPDGKIHCYKHDKYSMEYLDKYLHLFPYENKDLIYYIVQNHMRVRHYEEMRTGKKKNLDTHAFYVALRNFENADNEGRSEE